MGIKKRIAWNKGKKATQEQIRKNSESHKGQKAWNKDTKGIMKPNSTSFKKGQIPWSKGLTKETSELVRKIAEKRKGQKRTPEQRKRFSERLKKQYSNGWSPRKGKRHSEAAKQKMSKMKIGSNHPNFGKRLSSETRKKISVARQKQKLPFKDAKSTEIPLQKFLKKTGISFETHKNLQGQPDIFIKPNICIFVDGDHWHANPHRHLDPSGKPQPGHKPDDHIIGKDYARDRWARDAKVSKTLEERGYIVLRFWQSQLENNTKKCIQKIIKAVK